MSHQHYQPKITSALTQASPRRSAYHRLSGEYTNASSEIIKLQTISDTTISDRPDVWKNESTSPCGQRKNSISGVHPMDLG